MFEMSAGVIFSGLVVSALGFALFLYGKRSEQFDTLAGGLALMGLPMLVHSLVWMWVAAVGCCGGLVLWRKFVG